MLRLAVALLIALAYLVLPATATAAGGPEYEQQVLVLVNKARADAGLAPVAYNANLTASARGYANYMASANFFGHQGPDGSTLKSRDEAAGYRDWVFLGENLAAGQPDPRAVVDAWMNSPSHRENILSPSVRELGVGYVFRTGTTYGHYWVQEFGARAGAPVVTVPHSPVPGPAAAGSVLGATAEPAPANPPSQLRDSFDSVDTLGNALTGVVRDPASGQYLQYYQRAVLEWHPEKPDGSQVERRLIGDVLDPGADAAILPSTPPPGPSEYFPLSTNQPTGLGHFVADYTASGQPIYFKSFFDSHGGAKAFGFPKEEPKLRNGLWTQRFQAATLQYHPEFDRDGNLPGTTTPYRTYRVQLELLGEQALKTAQR